jgi:hypothetical protein
MRSSRDTGIGLGRPTAGGVDQAAVRLTRSNQSHCVSRRDQATEFLPNRSDWQLRLSKWRVCAYPLDLRAGKPAICAGNPAQRDRRSRRHKGMMRSSRLLRGVVVAGLLGLAAGCVSVSNTPLVPAGGGPAAAAVRHPGGPLPGLRYRYGGTATLTATSPPASAALPGANDVLVAGRAAGSPARPGGAVLLAAADSGIWRSADSGATWQRMLSGIQAWSVTPMTGGGYAAIGVSPRPGAPRGSGGVRQPEQAPSADAVSRHTKAEPEPTPHARIA